MLRLYDRLNKISIFNHFLKSADSQADDELQTFLLKFSRDIGTAGRFKIKHKSNQNTVNELLCFMRLINNHTTFFIQKKKNVC